VGGIGILSHLGGPFRDRGLEDIAIGTPFLEETPLTVSLL